MNANHSFKALSAGVERAQQPGRHPSRAPTMCKARPSLPTATDSPSSLVNPETPQMDSHLIVDIVTICIVVAIALLFLALKTWQRKKAAAAAAAADAAAAAAAALSVQTEGTQTDNLLFNIDDTINRLYQELSTHQQRLDSIEQNRLEMVNFNRLLSFLPKPTLPKEEDGFTHQDTDNSYVDSWGDNRNQYPAV